MRDSIAPAAPAVKRTCDCRPDDADPCLYCEAKWDAEIALLSEPGDSLADDLISEAGPYLEPSEADRAWYEHMEAREAAMEEMSREEWRAAWEEYSRWSDSLDRTVQCFPDNLPSGGAFGHMANEWES